MVVSQIKTGFSRIKRWIILKYVDFLKKINNFFYKKKEKVKAYGKKHGSAEKYAGIKSMVFYVLLNGIPLSIMVQAYLDCFSVWNTVRYILATGVTAYFIKVEMGPWYSKYIRRIR